MIVGLTGGIGCGKSTVLSEFSALGWEIFDADSICRHFYECRDSRVVAALQERWGERVFTADGGIDRRAIADIVFAAGDELVWLNGLFHPLVRELLNKAATKAANSMVICDVPLLYEVGWEGDFDVVIAVWTSPEQQQHRLRQRGWHETEISRRLNCQLDSDKKLEKADFGIINLYDFNLLKQQCIKLDQIIRKYYGRN